MTVDCKVIITICGTATHVHYKEHIIILLLSDTIIVYYHIVLAHITEHNILYNMRAIMTK